VEFWQTGRAAVLRVTSPLSSGVGTFKGDLIVSLVGTLLSRLIILASTPLMTRVYSASDYEVWVIIFALSAFLLPFGSMRYELAMVLTSSRRLAAALALAVGIGSGIVSILALVAWWLAPPSVLAAISGLGPGRQALLFLVPPVLLLIGMQAVLQAWATRQRQFGIQMWAQLTLAVVTTVVTLGLPLVTAANTATAAAGAILGLISGIGVLLWGCGGGLLTSVRQPGMLSAMLYGLRRYRVYALYMLPYSLSNVLNERFVQIVMASSFPVGTLAAFYVARQLVTAPAALIGNALRQVVFAYGAQSDTGDQMKTRVGLILQFLTGALAPLLAFGVFWIKPISAILFGDKWALMPEFTWWCMFMAGVGLLATWTDRIGDVLGRQKLTMWLQVGINVLTLTSLAVSHVFQFGPVTTVALFSVATVIGNLFWIALQLNLLGHSASFIVGWAIRLVGLTVGWSLVYYGVMSFTEGWAAICASLVMLAVSLWPTWLSVRANFGDFRRSP
jgi:O-antigen/teichoic acid export membrane protein